MECLIKVSLHFMKYLISCFSSSLWPEDHIRNGQVAETCGHTYNMEFGLNSNHSSRRYVIHSRALLTNVFILSNVIHGNDVPTQSSYPSSTPRQPVDATQTSYISTSEISTGLLATLISSQILTDYINIISPTATTSPDNIHLTAPPNFSDETIDETPQDVKYLLSEDAKIEEMVCHASGNWRASEASETLSRVY